MRPAAARDMSDLRALDALPRAAESSWYTWAMDTNDISRISRLSDQQLLAQVKLLAEREREVTSVLISHLAVFDERRLYLEEGCSSTFTYCVEVLHLSEPAAYKRIEVARAARKYPVILELLSDGSVNLTTVLLLAPHLTPANHIGLLAAARHQRKRKVEELVAALRPLPCVSSAIRRLPAPRYPSTGAPGAATAIAGAHDSPEAVLGLKIDGADPGVAPPAQADFLSRPAASLPARAVIQPLAPERFKVQFTASAQTCEKLRLAQDLLRHQIPDGDVGEVVDRALDALLDKLAKQKIAATDRPRTTGDRKGKGTAAVAATGSRSIPAEVRRTVWKRDGGRCAFIAHNGHRCTERAFLEFHHVVPYAAGGPPRLRTSSSGAAPTTDTRRSCTSPSARLVQCIRAFTQMEAIRHQLAPERVQSGAKTLSNCCCDPTARA